MKNGLWNVGVTEGENSVLPVEVVGVVLSLLMLVVVVWVVVVMMC